ncbi:MAG: hypothetical protein AAGH15_10000 [Myxococcota bacterium]
MRRVLLAALALALGATLATPTAAEAQAWVRDPGSGYVQLGYRVIRDADRFFDPSGDVTDIAPYTQHTLNLYGELGLVDRWLQLTVAGELFRRNVLVDQAAVAGIGDFRVGLYTGLYEPESSGRSDPFPVRITAGIEVGLPTGDPNPSPNVSQSDPNFAQLDAFADTLPTSDGEVDVTFRLLAGWGTRIRRGSRPSLDVYATGGVGYALRNTPRRLPAILEGAGDIRDQLQTRLELGIRSTRPVLDRFWFAVRYNGLYVVQNRNASGQQSFAGLGDGVEVSGIGFVVSAALWKTLRVSFGADGAVAARNLPSAAAYDLSLSYEF